MRGRRILHLVAAGGCAVGAAIGWSRVGASTASSSPSNGASVAETEETPAASVEVPVEVPVDPTASAADREAARAVAAETERGVWDRDAIARIRALMRDRSFSDVSNILILAGFERRTARRLGHVFASSPKVYDFRMGDRLLLVPWFVKVGASDWELTEESAENFRLPFHPKLPSPLQPPPSLGLTNGTYERCDAVGRHRFASGVFTEALKCTFGFRGHRFQITTSRDLLSDDWSIADRVDHALSNVPVKHLELVHEIVIDPGYHPNAAANTSWDGQVVSLFLAGAGRDVKQENLDRTTVHELGHVVSLQQDDGLWVRWDAAMAADKLGVSLYGMTNRVEDFAETYELYLGGGRNDAATRARYRNRFAVMDRLFASIG